MRVLSLSKTVNMLFIAPGDSLLRREARYYDAMSEYQIFNKRHTQKALYLFSDACTVPWLLIEFYHDSLLGRLECHGAEPPRAK